MRKIFAVNILAVIFIIISSLTSPALAVQVTIQPVSTGQPQLFYSSIHGEYWHLVPLPPTSISVNDQTIFCMEQVEGYYVKEYIPGEERPWLTGEYEWEIDEDEDGGLNFYRQNGAEEDTVLYERIEE